MNATQLARLTEEQARDMLERIRWPDGPKCPHCASDNATKLGGKAGEKGQHKCRDCRKKFTVRVGTIFEDSPIPLRDWVYAFSRMCASKKGISAHQLHRELGVTYKTAWFMCHRIRHAMADHGSSGPFTGIVESDEAYVGGKPRKINNYGYRGKGKVGRRNCTKQPIHALVERGGRKRTRVVANVTASNLRQNMSGLVDESAELHTDENNAYRRVAAEYAKHRKVHHGVYEYSRRDPDGVTATINTAESSFALIKRGVYGTFHHCSKAHLQRYLDEFDFRWNFRDVDDFTRTVEALRATEGKRLTYRRADAA